MDVELSHGEQKMQVSLPDTATVVRYGHTYTDQLAPLADPSEAVRAALRAPLGMPPLRELAGPGRRAVIGFPDRVKGGNHPGAHRRVSIPVIVAELLAGGCRIEYITLLCCMGLHRKNTVEEWRSYLGDAIVDLFGPDRIVNHDAEAEDLLYLGLDTMGNPIQCNRLIAEADIPIVLGHVSGNPYGGFSGGYKMIATGIAGWQSIAAHHCPQTMHRADWLGASTRSRMRIQFRSIGETMEERIGKRFFAVDAVLGNGASPVSFAAGHLAEVEKATWPLATRLTDVAVPMTEKADVLVFGLPRDFHYGPGMGTNPLLMALAISGQMSRCWGAFREGGVVIASALCDGWFNDDWFPSYRRTFEEFQDFATAADYLESQAAADLTCDAGYRRMYSENFTYHPFHAMSMLSGAAVSTQRCAAVYIVGARKPGIARAMGFRTTDTFEQALKDARRYVGQNPRVLCTPECFSVQAPIHLKLGST
jgi:nickel-dependent lactate racemase